MQKKTMQKKAAQKKAAQKNQNSKFMSSIMRNKFCWMSALAAAAIFLLVFIINDVVPFGGNTTLRIDLYDQYGPLFAEFYERFTGFDSFIYSWTSGLGSSFLGNFLNYISNPFAIIILLLGHERMPDAVGYMILLMAASSAGLFTYYLKHSFKKHDMTSAAFGLLYAFSGFFIAYYWNIMWLNAMLILPIVILGIERIINLKSSRTYLFAIAYAMITNYYTAFMLCIISVAYFLSHYFSKYKISDKIFAPDGRKYDPKKSNIIKKLYNLRFINAGTKFVFASLAAFGLMAMLYFPLYYLLQSTAATGHDFAEKTSLFFTAFDFLANHLASLNPTIYSNGNDIYPNISSGIITLILVPLYLYSKSISIREKITSVLLLAFMYFSMNINHINFIWHGFKPPNQMPYRFSFIYSFILIVLAFKAFIRIKEFSSKQLLYIGMAVIGFVLIVQQLGSKNVSETSIWLSIIFTIVYVALLAFMNSKKYQREVMAFLLLGVVCLEIVVADTPNYSMIQSKANFTSDYQDFVEMKENIDALNDENDFFRMDIAKYRTRMDPSWYYYNGISAFSSMAYEHVAKLQKKLGLYGNNMNNYSYFPQTAIYNSMFALKYVFDNNSNLSDNQPAYKLVDSNDSFTVYENEYFLPLAYAVDNDFLRKWNIESDNPFTVQNSFLTAATGVGDIFEPQQLKYSSSDSKNCKITSEHTLSTGNITFRKTDKNKEGTFVMTLTAKKAQNLYLFGSSSTIRKVQIGRAAKNSDKDKYDYSSLTHNPRNKYLLDLGYFEAGESLALKVTVPADIDSGSVVLRVSGLDLAEFEKGINIIKSNGTLDISEFDATYIKGTIKAPDSKLLYTSIPYDESWKVSIDGIEIPLSFYSAAGDAMLAVPLPAGEHVVEFSYVPRGMILGVSVTMVTVIALLLVWFLKKNKVFIFNPAYADDMYMPLTPEKL